MHVNEFPEVASYIHFFLCNLPEGGYIIKLLDLHVVQSGPACVSMWGKT
jgi:hypothetical protein